jgi:mannose-6-phosphate isomerase-like protein (cupin superfamily)
VPVGGLGCGGQQLAASDGQDLWFLGNLVTWKATGEQTHGRLTVAEFLHPAGFAPPLHRHLHEDEIFYILSGTAEFYCKGEQLRAASGDFVLLPVGEPHTFLVGSREPLHALQITTPSGFEHFAAAAGGPATERRLPDPTPLDDPALGHTATLHGSRKPSALRAGSPRVRDVLPTEMNRRQVRRHGTRPGSARPGLAGWFHLGSQFSWIRKRDARLPISGVLAAAKLFELDDHVVPATQACSRRWVLSSDDPDPGPGEAAKRRPVNISRDHDHASLMARLPGVRNNQPDQLGHLNLASLDSAAALHMSSAEP